MSYKKFFYIFIIVILLFSCIAFCGENHVTNGSRKLTAHLEVIVRLGSIPQEYFVGNSRDSTIKVVLLKGARTRGANVRKNMKSKSLRYDPTKSMVAVFDAIQTDKYSIKAYSKKYDIGCTKIVNICSDTTITMNLNPEFYEINIWANPNEYLVYCSYNIFDTGSNEIAKHLQGDAIEELQGNFGLYLLREKKGFYLSLKLLQKEIAKPFTKVRKFSENSFYSAVYKKDEIALSKDSAQPFNELILTLLPKERTEK